MVEFVRQTAIDAAKLLQKSIRTGKKVVGEKEGGGNLVTEADKLSEELIISRIRNQFPTDAILSEETESDIEQLRDAQRLWIVDPLDGTTNFKRGLENYAVSIAYLEKGEVQLAAIHDVTRNLLYWAEKGQGAHVRRGHHDRPLHLFDQNHPRDTIYSSGSPYDTVNFTRQQKIAAALKKAGARREIYGSAVIEAAMVAAGQFSLYFEIGLKPWDVAGTKLLVEEAGGVVGSFTGELDIFNPEEFVCGGRNMVKEFRVLAEAAQTS